MKINTLRQRSPLRLSRTTSEYDTVRARLAAHLPFRVVADGLTHLLPIDAGVAPSPIRNGTARVAERLEGSAADDERETEPAAELTLGLDTGFIRTNTPGAARHHAVLIGCAEHRHRRRRFAALQRDGAEAASVIRQHLDRFGYGADTELTVLTDGAGGLRTLARRSVDAPIPPILDWFHIAMRLQHMRVKARSLSTRVKTHREAKEQIRSELERLRWRLWNGRTDSVEQFRQELSSTIHRIGRYTKGYGRTCSASSSRALDHALRARALRLQP